MKPAMPVLPVEKLELALRPSTICLARPLSRLAMADDVLELEPLIELGAAMVVAELGVLKVTLEIR